jgi:twitching motility protein PilT
MHIDVLLRFMVKQQASDLHVKPKRPPLVRLKGRLIPLKANPLSPEDLENMLQEILTDRQRDQLQDQLYADFGYSLHGVSRFRATVFYQRGTLSGVFRRVPFEFPGIDEWGLPEVLKEFTDLRQGLVLVTGPTGSGKSSTLAAMMREVIQKRLVHVVTIEDPIEFLIKDELGAITQREVGSDTRNFADALRNTLRQDPDVIMVGEMRDLETMRTALTAAETGHLVFSTLHTNGAAHTVDRIIDTFPDGAHRQVRQQLGMVLQGVVSLELVQRKDGEGLIAAVEILRSSPRVGKLISEGNTGELHEEIGKSVSFYRMQTMNQSLLALVINGVVHPSVALAASPASDELDLMLRKWLYTGAVEGEDAMADSMADYSKIQELLEIRRLYEELQDKYETDMAEAGSRVEYMESELRQRSDAEGSTETRVQELEKELEHARRALEVQRQEWESKVERLQVRIKELLAAETGTDSGRPGFFRR